MKKSTYVLIYGIAGGVLLCGYGWYAVNVYEKNFYFPFIYFPELVFFLDPVLLLLAVLPESLLNWAAEADWKTSFLFYSFHFITGFLVGTLIGNLHYRLAQIPNQKI